MLKIDASAKISDFAEIEHSKRGSVVFVGQHTVIDSFVKIKMAGGSGNIEIGNYCFINSGCVIYSGNGVKIGNHVSIAANSTLASTNHEYIRRDFLIQSQGFRPSKGGIVIGNDVWIGANCVLLDGSIIGDGCVIAAGSVVRDVLEPCCIYAGNPIKKIGERT